MHHFFIGLVAFYRISVYPPVYVRKFVASRAYLIGSLRYFAIGAKGTEKQRLVTFLKIQFFSILISEFQAYPIALALHRAYVLA